LPFRRHFGTNQLLESRITTSGDPDIVNEAGRTDPSVSWQLTNAGAIVALNHGSEFLIWVWLIEIDERWRSFTAAGCMFAGDYATNRLPLADILRSKSIVHCV
jgi:hypothetical protein